MSRRAGHVVVFGLALAGVGTLAATAEGEAREECLFNDDCVAPLVCEARRCRVQCRSDRDCSPGARCAVNTASPMRNMCVTVTSTPPANGFIVGRVDASPGVPLTRCVVDLGNANSLSGECDGRGEFIIANVPPGRYDVRVRPNIEDGAGRTVVAYVDAGLHASVGTITLLPRQAVPTYNAPGYGGTPYGIAPVVVVPVPQKSAPPKK